MDARRVDQLPTADRRLLYSFVSFLFENLPINRDWITELVLGATLSFLIRIVVE